MAKKLDRKKPFGEINGDAGNARYFQDNIYFDASDNEIVTTSPSKASPSKGKASAPAPAPAPEPVAVEDLDQEFTG